MENKELLGFAFVGALATAVLFFFRLYFTIEEHEDMLPRPIWMAALDVVVLGVGFTSVVIGTGLAYLCGLLLPKDRIKSSAAAIYVVTFLAVFVLTPRFTLLAVPIAWAVVAVCCVTLWALYALEDRNMTVHERR